MMYHSAESDSKNKKPLFITFLPLSRAKAPQDKVLAVFDFLV